MVRIVQVQANRNFDEGIDLDEEGTGDIIAYMNEVVTTGMTDHAISMTEDEEEEAGGDIITQLQNVNASGNGDEGIKLRNSGPAICAWR